MAKVSQLKIDRFIKRNITKKLIQILLIFKLLSLPIIILEKRKIMICNIRHAV